MAHRLQNPAKLRRAVVCARMLVFLLALPLFLSPFSNAQSAKEESKPAKPSGTAQLRIELTGGDAKKPVADASVYVKFTDNGILRDKRIEFNLKTNQNGVARSPEIPKGRVLIQIVSPGWKTFGQYYDIDRDERISHQRR